MDYEKKYKEALERAKEYLNPVYPIADKTLVQEIFPELRESEDERIRKKLISRFRWLKENVLFDGEWGCFKIDDIIAFLERYKEQKPAEWHPEDEQNLNVCLSYIKDESLRSWLKDAIHARYDKPAWNEEDEKMFWAVVDKLPACKERRWLIIRFHSIDIEKKKSWKPSEDEESKK